ncbi:uncharacterized protein N7496_003295 [Penicillium cataractarum]|uniref:Uncharacterized protein n=1 Tax=Penicillium cataractarum TaxID=2100454 RepID=A0A9W9SM86_9EURO|nr:uncharacterized protein N7496_003295 [Penicillium cataractarum]KAJ5380867.1 hypothetical protein N7496_003295 [Penicillium cataractarum]
MTFGDAQGELWLTAEALLFASLSCSKHVGAQHQHRKSDCQGPLNFEQYTLIESFYWASTVN